MIDGEQEKAPARHIGNVLIDTKILMTMLGFPGAQLRCICQEEMAWNPDRLIISIIHPEMPEVIQGECIKQVVPEYTVTDKGDGSVPSVTRLPLR